MKKVLGKSILMGTLALISFIAIDSVIVNPNVYAQGLNQSNKTQAQLKEQLQNIVNTMKAKAEAGEGRPLSTLPSYTPFEEIDSNNKWIVDYLLGNNRRIAELYYESSNPWKITMKPGRLEPSLWCAQFQSGREKSLEDISRIAGANGFRTAKLFLYGDLGMIRRKAEYTEGKQRPDIAETLGVAECWNIPNGTKVGGPWTLSHTRENNTFRYKKAEIRVDGTIYKITLNPSGTISDIRTFKCPNRG